MRFVVHADALNGDDEVLSLVDRLVDRVADEVHRVEVPDADLLQISKWFASARQTRRKVLTTAIAGPPRRQVNPLGPHAKQIEIRSAEDALIADRLAHAPLQILVEDREADGILLEMLVEELGSPELCNLWKQGQTVTPRAIEISNSGGIDAMPQRVERAVSDAADERRPVRLFILCDSDARWPSDRGHNSQGTIDRLRQLCADQSIPLHVLRKRNAENYIPDSVFEAVRDDPLNTSNRHRFDVFLNLKPEQRDHFPIKDGLSAAGRSDAVAAGLYDSSEEADLKLLEKPLLPRRPRPLLQLQRERRTKFSAPGLRARDGNGEIDVLLNAIAREL